MNEVISRRLKHSIGKTDEAFGDLPDVIFVDGGITQIHAAKTSCSRIKTEITNLWNGKDDKHSTRALINENERRNTFIRRTNETDYLFSRLHS